MRSTGFVAWGDVRRRWRSYAGLALLVALTIGLGLSSIAGARRTQSAYPRFLRSAQVSTLSFAIAGYDSEFDAMVAAFPEVVQSRTYVGLPVSVLVDGRPDPAQEFEATGTFDGRFFDQDRFTPTSGRRPDPSRPDEIAVNEFAAKRLGYRVGQRLELGTYALEQWQDPTFFTDPPPPEVPTQATIVGVGLFPDEVLQDEGDRTVRVLFTPAFSERARPFVTYGLQGLVLARGDADVSAVKARLLSLMSRDELATNLTSVDTFHALQAMRPLAVTLALFGVIALVAGMVLAVQAIERLIRRDDGPRAVLRACGASSQTIVRATMLGPVAAVIGGVVLAALSAVAVSPAMPLGPVRKVEVDRGIDVDLTVLGLGGLAVVALLVGATGVLAWRRAPHRLARRLRSPSRSVRVLPPATTGLPAPTQVGLSFAFPQGPARRTDPARSVMAAAVVATAALVSAVTFGASLHSLVRQPELYGWSWDATILSGNGYDNIPADRARQILDDDPLVAAWSGAYFGSDSIDGHDVPLLGMDPRSAIAPPIVEGRSIGDEDEIVLGPATAAQLGVGLGDQVSVGPAGRARTLTVVGLAVFPTVGMAHVAHTSLGVGALVVPELVPGSDLDILGVPTAGLGPNAVFIRFRPGTDVDQGIAHLVETTRPLVGFAGLDVLAPQRPAEIVNSSSIGNAPVVLAFVLGAGATVSLALMLGASIRHRRRDLAVLKTLGFTRRQVSAAVSLQATATAVVGLLLGMPAGALFGRTLWLQFAHQLDVVTRVTVPIAVLLGLGLVAVAIANLIAAVPARAARDVEPASLLHGE